MNRSILRVLAPLSLVLVSRLAQSATVPAGFTETVLTSDLSSPTSMALAPDGRFFVTQQGGDLRVVENGALLPAPFVSLPVNDDGERGLLGVALDPDFAHNQYVYVYYTARTPAIHNRVSRFTAQGNVAAPGSETVLFDLDNLSGATNHNGGALHFGPDGKLYFAAGENANPPNSQSLGTVLGKILRINANGSIPVDNPFFGTASGKNRAIWALGLRNPFTFTFAAQSPRMFINDVGQDTWEEINDGVAGSNYGWPNSEGPTSNPAYRAPLFAYSHDNGCAITGGAFYDPSTQQFPAAFAGKYFFSDLCGGWIHRFDPATKAVTTFASGINSPVDLLVDANGNLYYLAYGAGALVRISASTNSGAPQIVTGPRNVAVNVGATATFRVTASGAAPLAYQWRRGDQAIPGATAAQLALTSVTLADDGATFSVVVSNGAGTATSGAATLHVLNPAPAGGGLGLLGSYYDGIGLTGPARTRLDKQVDFDWSTGQALPGLDGDTFSVRWTGRILAKGSGVYTFTTNSDDGVRLFVGNKRVIDNWTDHSPAENSGSVSLVAGQLYDIRLEFYEDFGTAVIQLFWQGPGVPRQIVPQKNLFPYALVLTGEPPATAADAAVSARLFQDGFAPVQLRGALSSVNDAKGKALLLVSATVDPATIRARFRASATPAIVWESALFDDFGLTGTTAGTSFGTVANATSLRIVKPGHALAAGLTNLATVTTAPSTFSFGEPGPQALVIGREPAAPSHPLLFAYERGAATITGPAAARRVGIFFGDTTAANLTPSGWALFDAAARWAVGR